MNRILASLVLVLVGLFVPAAAGEAQVPIPHWKVFFADHPDIRRELSNLYDKSPSVHTLMDELAATDATVIFTPVLMVNRVAGRTRVYDNNSAEVAIDLRKAKTTDHTLAYTLAHELFHVKDGLVNHTPGTFMQGAADTKLEEWRQRPHEKVAIDFEEKVKAELAAAR